MNKVFNTNMLTTIMLLGILMLTSPVSADSQWDIKEIYNQNNSVPSAEISGDYVVFLTSGPGMNQSSNRIYLYNINSGDKRIIGTPSPGMTVTGNGISDNHAVWFETRADNFETEQPDTKSNIIYLMDTHENTTKILSLSETAQWPKVSGDTILWSESPADSMETDVSIYNIATEKNTRILNLSPEDPAGIKYSNGNIGYADSKGLRIYNTKSGKENVAFTSEYGNESGSDVMDFDMAGDYLIYFKHQAVFKGDDKGVYDEPYLYTISTGETTLLNPITGNFADTLTKDEKKASIVSPFTDGKTIGWGYMKSDTESDIIFLNPKTGNSSKITVQGLLSEVHADGDRLIWTKSDFMSFDDKLYIAEEYETAESTRSESAPGFSVITAISGISAFVYLMRRNEK